MATRKIWLVSCIDVDAINGGGGQNNSIMYARKTSPAEFFVEERHARARAERMARENPMQPYGIFAVESVVETSTAPIINKTFTPDGELVPVTA